MLVKNLPLSCSWQDLKDHMRKAGGDVTFAQVRARAWAWGRTGACAWVCVRARMGCTGGEGRPTLELGFGACCAPAGIGGAALLQHSAAPRPVPPPCQVMRDGEKLMGIVDYSTADDMDRGARARARGRQRTGLGNTSMEVLGRPSRTGLRCLAPARALVPRAEKLTQGCRGRPLPTSQPRSHQEAGRL